MSFPRNKLVPRVEVQILMHKGKKDGGSERTSSPKLDKFPQQNSTLNVFLHV